MAYTDTSALSNLIDTVYTKLAILKANGVAVLWNKPYVNKYDLSQYGSGSTIKVPVFSDLASATTELSETADPTAVAMSASTADITLKEYGNLIQITEKVELTTPNPIITSAVERIGQNMGKSLDDLFFTAATGGTNVIYGGNATDAASIDANDTFSADVLINAIQVLEDNDTPRFEDDMYIAIISPKQAADLKKDADFRAAVSYGGYDKILKGYIGDYQGAHVLVSSHVPSDNNGTVDYYKAIVFGQNALGFGQGYEPKVIIIPPVDALQRITSVGWKSLIGFSILVDDYIVKILSA